MRFTEYGSRSLPTVLFLQGSCTTAETCYSKIVPMLSESFHCVLCHLDGHEPDKQNHLVSVKNECAKIEKFVMRHYNGHIYGIVALSLGATITVSLMSRGNITADKILLDGVYLEDVGGFKTWACIITCVLGIKWLRRGAKVPDKLVEIIFGRGNSAITEMLYPGVSSVTVRNMCRDVYRYHIDPKVAEAKGDILCIRGEFEPIPKRSVQLLKQYLPRVREQVTAGVGHAQLLHEHTEEYSALVRNFLE